MKYCEHCDRWWSNDKEVCPQCEDKLQRNDTEEESPEHAVHLEVHVGHA